MKNSLLCALVLGAAIVAIPGASAEANQFKKRGFSNSTGAKGVQIRRPRRARPKQLTGHRRRSASPATFGTIQALSVYLQWRKCLDNILPQCP